MISLMRRWVERWRELDQPPDAGPLLGRLVEATIYTTDITEDRLPMWDEFGLVEFHGEPWPKFSFNLANPEHLLQVWDAGTRVGHMTDDTQDRVEAMRFDFTNHTPDADDLKAIGKIRASAKLLGEVILENTPVSREQSVALTELKTALQWAVAAAVLPAARERENGV